MAHPEDKQSSTPEQAPVEESRAGRVVVDSRGRNVWQWAKAAIDSTSILLKRLENKDLALEPTQKVPIMRGANSRADTSPPQGQQAAPGKPGAKPATRADRARRPDRADTGGGFDPYNSR